MGGLRTRMPFAFFRDAGRRCWRSAVPGFSGSSARTTLIYGTLAAGATPWLYAAGVLTAGITAYYSSGLLFVTFFGPDNFAGRLVDAAAVVGSASRLHGRAGAQRIPDTRREETATIRLPSGSMTRIPVGDP